MSMISTPLSEVEVVRFAGGDTLFTTMGKLVWLSIVTWPRSELTVISPRALVFMIAPSSWMKPPEVALTLLTMICSVIASYWA